jgi:ferritin-like metal-binding protein YciE
MSKTEFQNLFVEQLKDVYIIEKQIIEALPLLVDAAESPELKDTIKTHLAETRNHVERLKKIFKMLQMEESRGSSKIIEGFIQTGREIINNYPESAVRDAALIALVQRVEHDEIAIYGTLYTFAKQLDLDDAADLLHDTLKEEGNADKKLTGIAEGGLFAAGVNQRASK